VLTGITETEDQAHRFSYLPSRIVASVADLIDEVVLSAEPVHPIRTSARHEALSSLMVVDSDNALPEQHCMAKPAIRRHFHAHLTPESPTPATQCALRRTLSESSVIPTPMVRNIDTQVPIRPMWDVRRDLLNPA